MPKRKAKTETLTKIDPSTLKYKPPAVSQHSDDRGTRVTTTLNPVQPPLFATLPEPVFSADPSHFGENHPDDGDDNDASGGYYSTQVRALVCS